LVNLKIYKNYYISNNNFIIQVSFKIIFNKNIQESVFIKYNFNKITRFLIFFNSILYYNIFSFGLYTTQMKKYFFLKKKLIIFFSKNLFNRIYITD
jgi:hypothetical protein